jgi:hypothetical protein
VGVCNQITLLIHYYISSRLVIHLKITVVPIKVCNIFYLTVSFKFINFSFQICCYTTEIHPSLPTAPPVHVTETYKNTDLLLKLFKYGCKICGDLKIIGLLLGIKSGYTKICCFLHLFSSRGKKKSLNWLFTVISASVVQHTDKCLVWYGTYVEEPTVWEFESFHNVWLFQVVNSKWHFWGICSSKMQVTIYHITRCNIPTDLQLYQCCSDKLKCCTCQKKSVTPCSVHVFNILIKM